MYHLNKNKKKKNVIASVTLFTLATIIGIPGAATIIGINQSADASSIIDILGGKTMKMRAQAPVVVSGDNIYIAWWTNNTANNNEEVMFRASNDGGATFGDKINLSNTTDADSWRVEIAGEGADVAVTWWETNQTSDTPVARISTDGGQTFGPLLRLATNGTISSTEGEEGEAVEEEAVGGAEVAE
jgi:hypothetical protein